MDITTGEEIIDSAHGILIIDGIGGTDGVALVITMVMQATTDMDHLAVVDTALMEAVDLLMDVLLEYSAILLTQE